MENKMRSDAMDVDMSLVEFERMKRKCKKLNALTVLNERLEEAKREFGHAQSVARKWKGERDKISHELSQVIAGLSDPQLMLGFMDDPVEDAPIGSVSTIAPIAVLRLNASIVKKLEAAGVKTTKDLTEVIMGECPDYPSLIDIPGMDDSTVETVKQAATWWQNGAKKSKKVGSFDEKKEDVEEGYAPILEPSKKSEPVDAAPMVEATLTEDVEGVGVEGATIRGVCDGSWFSVVVGDQVKNLDRTKYRLTEVASSAS